MASTSDSGLSQVASKTRVEPNVPVERNVTAVAHAVAATRRADRFGHEGCVFLLTGLSGSGKSTLAMALKAELTHLGYACYSLDGDNLRKGLNEDLGFSPEARSENIRRVGEVAALFGHAGMVCIAALISPYERDRMRARRAADAVDVAFYEVHVAADLETCEARDPKGLYRKAGLGELQSFTGIDAPMKCRGIPTF